MDNQERIGHGGKADAVTRRAGARRWLTSAVGLLAVVLIVHSGWNVLEGRRLNRTIRAQAAVGLPMSLTAILPEPVLESRNAALPLTAAFSVMGGESPGHEDTVETVRELLAIPSDEPVDRDKIAGLLERMAEPDLAAVFQFLTIAAEGLPAQFPVKSDAGWGALTLHFAPLRSAHHLLVLRASLARQTGKYNEALRDLRSALRLTRGLSKEPLIASHRLRMLLDRRTLRELDRLLGRVPLITGLESAVLNRILITVAEPRDNGLPIIIRALDGERVMLGGWLFVSLLSREGDAKHREILPTSAWLPGYTTYLARPLLKADARFFLLRVEAYRQKVNAGNIQALNALSARRISRRYPLTRVVEPSLASLWKEATLWLTDLQLAEWALRLRLHAQTVEAFPASLMAIADTEDDQPIDMLGNPLSYMRVDGGYQLFSHGFSDPDRDPPPDDLVWGTRR